MLTFAANLVFQKAIESSYIFRIIRKDNIVVWKVSIQHGNNILYLL